MKNEPVVTRTAVAAAVTLLVTLLGAFDVKVGDETTAKLVDSFTVLVPLAVWAWAAWSARNRVTPVRKGVGQ